MRNLLNKLRESLNALYPTYTQVPEDPHYPHIEIQIRQFLKGLPWGPHIMMVNLILLSRYKGTREILRMIKKVETALHLDIPKLLKSSLKIKESSMILSNDGETRIHTFGVKIRYREAMND